MSSALGIRWLGNVPYAEAEVLQRAMHGQREVERLLLLEHPHTYTLGSRADLRNVLVDPKSVGAELVQADRGGDVTYHGPGQLVGYPILTLERWMRSGVDVVAYVRTLEHALIEALATLGITAGQNPGFSGVWLGEGDAQRKIAAIGVKVARGRTRHGFALNVDPDLGMFEHIVPCGIREWGVTSVARERETLGLSPVTFETVVQAVANAFAEALGASADTVVGLVEAKEVEPHDLSHLAGERHGAGFDDATSQPVRLMGRLADAGVDVSDTAGPRPEWMRVQARMDPEFLRTRAQVRENSLVTVCEEAGCPNMYECWSAGTATFMINGERCTRACGFCLVDTRKPLALDHEEPKRVAEAVRSMGLAHAVVTCVARDDLDDQGSAAFAETVAQIRAISPLTQVELLISDCRGDAQALETIFASRPEVLNHNLETVVRLQRAVRPSAGYARSLAVLARAKAAGLTTKSGLIAGMGETPGELREAMDDLRAVGVDVLTVGQYLQPSPRHLPVFRWYTPEEFAELKEYGMAIGFQHVESGPLVRSSYHARDAVAAVRTQSDVSVPVSIASR